MLPLLLPQSQYPAQDFLITRLVSRGVRPEPSSGYLHAGSVLSAEETCQQYLIQFPVLSFIHESLSHCGAAQSCWLLAHWLLSTVAHCSHIKTETSSILQPPVTSLLLLRHLLLLLAGQCWCWCWVGPPGWASQQSRPIKVRAAVSLKESSG